MSEEAKQWPDLVGKPAEEAKTKILADNPKLTVEILDETAVTTTDHRPDRVRIFKNAEGNVASVPKTG